MPESEHIKVIDTYPLPFLRLELHTRFPDSPETKRLVKILTVIIEDHVDLMEETYLRVKK